MHKIRLLLSYDGTPFQGWQKQPSHQSVQGTLENILSHIYNEPIRVIGSGRTDAGTHAIGQVAHFTAPKVLSSESKLVRSLNALLPPEIAVKGAWIAPDDFHAQRSASRKTYIYRIWNHTLRSALWPNRALHVPNPLDTNRLQALAEVIKGRKDFKSFQTQGTDVKSTIRNIDQAEFRTRSGHLIEFRISGSGFLKQMVRNLVGTMLYLERHGGQPADFEGIFNALDRGAAKGTAPAHGLYLYRVEYPEALDNRCRKL